MLFVKEKVMHKPQIVLHLHMLPQHLDTRYKSRQLKSHLLVLVVSREKIPIQTIDGKNSKLIVILFS